MNDRSLCTVELSPDEVDAGADIMLTVHVECPRQDLKRPSVLIRNQDDGELARAQLKKSEENGYESDDIALPAPQSVGEYVYRAVVVAADKDGGLQERASAEVRFVVKPHEAQLNVWDVPPTVGPGERLKFMVGVRCSAGCSLAGRGVSVVDCDGTQIGCANLGEATWPGTDALFVAAIEAEAPSVTGAYQWEVRTEASCSEPAHAAGSMTFGLKVVSSPNCEVTVEAIDREKQTPIKDARVVMHPYRAMTAEDGIAKLKVRDGQYDLLVSASKYLPVSMVINVAADVVTRAELDVEPSWDSLDEA